MRFITDFRDGDVIIGHYLCKQKQMMTSKAGKAYISVILSDRTGSVDGKIWELNNAVQDFAEGEFIKVEGTVSLYQENLQLKITKLRRSGEGEYSPSDYVPATDKDIDVLYAKLTGFIDSIENPHIKLLAENIILGNERVSGALKSHSAAKTMHHSYLGGLLEHTVSVAETCEFVGARYKSVNMDILIASALLHDIGKVFELSPFPLNEYTDEGELVGHIVIGSELISAEAEKITGFPETLKNLLKHCMLAHHGEYEFGSPKLPKIIEAFILHACDNLDAKVKAFEESLIKDGTAGNWIGWNKMLARNLRKSVF